MRAGRGPVGGLVEMTVLLGCLERDLSDAAALQQLAKHFHALAGMGGTYGFPRVTELGDEAERVMGPLLKRAGTPDAAMVAHWWELAQEIGRELEKEPEAGPNVPRFEVLVALADAELAARVAEALEREGLLTATRTPGGHRLYAPHDVERIRQIKAWQAQRLSLEQIHQRSQSTGGTYESLVTAIVMSDLVQMTQTETSR